MNKSAKVVLVLLFLLRPRLDLGCVAACGGPVILSPPRDLTDAAQEATKRTDGVGSPLHAVADLVRALYGG